MAIKEILDKIKASLGADASAEITALLADAKREVEDILDSNSSANKESASRKAKIRELEAELERVREEAAKATSPEHKAELERLRKIEAQHLSAQAEADAKLKATWAEKSKTLAVDKTAKIYDKVQKVIDRFALPTEGQELTLDQIRQNLSTYELLESTQYFTAETNETGGRAPITGNTKPTYKSSGEAIAAQLGYKQ
jgi:hypothetical protein